MKSVLIISGYNTRAIIAFCRFFKTQSIPFYIVASSKEDLILLSEYKSNVIFIREDKSLKVEGFHHYKELVDKYCLYDDILILPSTEYLNRFLIKERKTLENIGYTVPLVNDSLYSQISDKYSFGQMCEEEGIRVPKELTRITKKDIPFVIKPKQYFIDKRLVNTKPNIVRSESDFNLYYSQKVNDSVYYQEFIGGEPFYLLFYFDKEGGHSVYSQRNIMQQDNGLSIIAAESSDFHKEYSEITSKFCNLFLKHNYRGLVMVEVKLYENKVYMIEANPRLWGPSQLITNSGMDLMHKFAKDYGLIEKDFVPSYKLKAKYFWSGGIAEDQVNNRDIVFYNYSISDFFSEYTDWAKNDVYLQNDTRNIFIKEIKTSI